MKKLLLTFLLAASAMLADPPRLVPVGAWPLCISGVADPNFCADTSQRSLLLIRATDVNTTGYVYTVTAKTFEGQALKVTGYAERTDLPDGLTTAVLIPMGIVYEVQISVTEVVAIAKQ